MSHMDHIMLFVGRGQPFPRTTRGYKNHGYGPYDMANFYIMDTGGGTFCRSYPSFKLEHSLEPIVMTNYYNKAEKKFFIDDIRSNERPIDCFCVKKEISMMGKLIWVIGILLAFGVVTSLLLSIRIVKSRSKLVAIKNNPNLSENQNKR